MSPQTVSRVLTALVNGGIVSVLITMVVWALLRITPRRALNAATRYAIWWVALAIVIALPGLYLARSVPTTAAPLAVVEADAVPQASGASSEPAVRLDNVEAVAEAVPVTDFAASSNEAPSRVPRFPIEIHATASSGVKSVATFGLLWIAVTLAMLGRLFLAVIALHNRKTRAFAAPAHIAQRLSHWLETCGTKRRVVLAASTEITTPMAAGMRSPSILIPAQLFSELEFAELDQIGLHETAHLARHDDYALIVQRVIEALFALHPVVRWIARRIDLEREIACDDFVLEATGHARPYATCLTKVVELAGGTRASLIAAAATEEPSHLARRVEMLLDKKRHTGTRLLKSRLAGAMILLAGLVIAIAAAPGVFAFAVPERASFDAGWDETQPPIPPEPPQSPRKPFAPMATTPPSAPNAPEVPSALGTPYAPQAPLAPEAPQIPPVPAPALAPFAPLPPKAFSPEAAPAPMTPLDPGAPMAPPSPMAPPAAQAPPAPQAPPPPRDYVIDANETHGKTPIARAALPAIAPRALPGLAFAPQGTPPAPPAPAAAPQGSTSYNVRSHNGEVDSDWTWRDGLNSRTYRMHGRVEFTDDESDVKSIPPGGWFSYEESHALASRKYQVSADSSGAIKRQYLVDGRDHAFDDDARAWLRASLPELLRESAVDAPARVQRLMKKGGANAVIAEIGKIRSSGARRVYIQELVPVGNLNTEQFQTLLRDTRAIPSDGDKASVLVFLSRYTLKDSLRDHVFDATSTISSSGDRRRVLMSFIQQDRSRATLAGAAKSAEQINSDGDKAALLVELANHYRGNEEMRRPFFRTLETIHSSGDRARVLMAVIRGAANDRDTLVDTLHSVVGVNSDGDKARVLVFAAEHWKDDEATRRAFFESANGVHSSGDHSRVLMNLAGRSGLSAATWVELVHSADRIPSDGDKARVLLSVIDRSDVSVEALIAAVQSAARIPSESEKARILLAAIERSSGKPTVRTEIRNAVRSIRSDGEYRRVMSALDRQMAL